MAFWNRRRKQADDATLTAAAQPVQTDRSTASEAALKQYKTWQDEAWAMYDALGEFRQGVTWLGNVLSRARLVPAYAPVNPGDEPEIIDPDTGDPAVDFVESIAHGIGGQAELLRSAAVHLTVPGEGWFVGQVDSDEEGVSWRFYSRDEVKQQRGEVRVRVDEQKWVTLPADSLPIRVWRPHDRYHYLADSSARAALPIMRRLELLNRRVDAQLQSRLSMNGITLWPTEASFPVKPQYKQAEDPFIAELMDYGATAIRTPGSAAAALPYNIRMKGDLIDKIKHVRFADEVTPEVRADREFEIRRLATAMDVPPEVLLGMAGMNHWGAWQIEESALKTTVTNLLELVCWSLTTGYLRPAMAALREMPDETEGETEGEGELPGLEVDRIVWYDLSELAVRPDRSADALTLDDRILLSRRALARETGFSEDDMLGPEDLDEVRFRLGLKLAQSPTTTPVGMEMLGLRTAARPALGEERQSEADEINEGVGTEPVNEGDLPRDDAERGTPESNGDVPVAEREPAS